MKQMSMIIAAVALIGVATSGLPPSAWAGSGVEAQTAATEKTVTFVVDKMTCAACPITVRKAMEKVKGVKSVTVDFQAKTATVVFDPAVTTPEKIGAASTNAGYPASPKS